MVSREQFDAERQLRQEAEQRIADLNRSMEDMRRQFQVWQEQEQQRAALQEQTERRMQEEREQLTRLRQEQLIANQAITERQAAVAQAEAAAAEKTRAVDARAARERTETSCLEDVLLVDRHTTTTRNTENAGTQPRTIGPVRIQSFDQAAQAGVQACQAQTASSGAFRAQTTPTSLLQQRTYNTQPSQQHAFFASGNNAQHASQPPPGFSQLVNQQSYEARRQQPCMEWVAMPQGRHQMPFAMTCDLLPKFGADKSMMSVKVWINKVVQDAQTYRWSEDEQFIAATRALVGPAKRWLDCQNSVTNWESMRAGLESAFGRQVLSLDVHEKMRRKKKTTKESLLEYVHDMEHLGMQGSLDEEAVRHYIARGITDDMHLRLLFIGAKTRSEFMMLLESHEREKKEWDEDRSQKNHDSSQKKDRGRAREKNCYACNSAGHLLKDCPEKDKIKSGKCFKCNKTGHLKRDCPDNSAEGARDKPQFNQSAKPKIERIGVSGNRSALTALVGGVRLECQLDSGADRHILREDAFLLISEKKKFKLLRPGCTLQGAGGTVRTLGETVIPTEIFGVRYELLYSVVPTGIMPSKVLLGDPLLDVANITLSRDGPKIEPLVGSAYIQLIQSETKHDIECILQEVSKEYREEVRALIDEYKPEQTGQVPVVLKVRLKEDRPVVSRPRRLSPQEEKEVRDQVDDWLARDVIESAHSEFSSPVVVTRKKNGQARVCIDYKRVNKIVEKQHGPIAMIEDAIDATQGSAVHTCLDLKDGFFHVNIEKESRKILAFVTPWGQFVPKRAPFGFCNSPAVFTQYVLYIFSEQIRQGIVIVYCDDLFIKASNEREALERLTTVLEIARKFGLQINWRKCQILQRRVEFLGYVVEEGTIKPSSGKVEALLKWPTPRTTKQLQRFLGLAGYFRKFIQNFANTARDLSDLLKKNVKFVFGRRQEQAFVALKRALVQAPVLHLYNKNKETELHTDASIDGYGAILMQRCKKDNDMHPVYYMSRKTLPSERNYHSYELETLAVVRALEKFRIYLQGIHFKIVTDCSALQLTLSNEHLKPRLARWNLYMEMFDYKIEHRSGDKMRHVDALSRRDCVMTIQDPVTERLRRAQLQDEKLQAIRALLQNGVYKNYTLDNELVFIEDQGERKLVVPRGLQNDVIRAAHEVGHFAVKKAIEKLQQQYHFDFMKKKVETFIQNCLTCIMANRKQGKQEGLLCPIPKVAVPLHTWHVDHVGKLASTSKNYNHLLVVVDAFTKYTWIFPTKSTGTGEVVSKINLLKQHFGNPRRIISDRGTAFTSHEWADYCNQEGIQHLLITTGVPRGNGQVERVNGVIESLLARLAVEEPRKWYKYVPRVQLAVNGSFHRAIGASPYELLFGTKLRNSENNELLEIVEEELRQKFDQARSDLRQTALVEIDKVQQENCRSYNKKRKKATKYKEDDIVAIKRTQFGPGLKFAIKFLGPYKITKVQAHDRYEVEKIGDEEGPVRTTCSADNMKPWRGFYDDLEADEFDE